MRLIVILMMLVNSSFHFQQSSCGCSPPIREQKTSWGKDWVIITESENLKLLQGKAVSTREDATLANVLVEVYDQPDILLLDWKERSARISEQHRIAACVTGKDGRFCFRKIPPGKYELRCSRSGEWDPTSVIVNIGSKNEKASVTIWMRLSH